ncbi:MAG TPA: cupin domain-containing protein [Solirubrobacterales bacterium]|jgi:quercetin dioxygenase-like cupin family protein|nr:cupin domain-containing protein [Solirubrobacterales bacterium]
MAHAGDRLEMPDGSVYEVTEATSEGADRSVGMNFILPSGSVSPPPHRHPNQTESFRVVEGPIELMVDGEWRTLQTGETASVPPGTVHTFRNRSSATVTLHSTHTPAGRFEEFIEHISRLLPARGIKGGKDPRIPIYLSMILLQYPDTIRPGRDRERLAINLMASLGRLLRFDTDLEAT